MKVDDTYNYCLRHANNGARMVADGTVDESYIEQWSLRVAEQIIKLNAAHGLSILNLPEA